MAVIAIGAARYVCRVFATGSDAVVTGAASADDVGMIDITYRDPYRWTVAIFTNVSRRNMRRILAGGFDTVVATDAITKDVHVREVRRYPGSRHMAVIAGVVAAYVRRVFARRSDTVVTANAVSHDIAVIEKCRQPGRCIVTIIALITGGNVGRRLARCLHTIVA